jgi:hypothetical protein
MAWRFRYFLWIRYRCWNVCRCSWRWWWRSLVSLHLHRSSLLSKLCLQLLSLVLSSVILMFSSHEHLMASFYIIWIFVLNFFVTPKCLIVALVIYVPMHEGTIFRRVMDIVLVDATTYHHDIAFVVNVVSWNMQAPKLAHFQVIFLFFVIFDPTFHGESTT